MEGPPTVEVEVFSGGGVHVDVEVAWFVDSHVIESWIGSSGEAIVLALVSSCAFVWFGTLGIIGVSTR